jgi:putative solute:sodium symporter small subunit
MAIDSAPPDDTSLSRDERFRACIDRYWRRNVVLMLALLLIWAGVSLGCGILFADALNGLRLGGFPLGFWFAQQGSIVVFVLLILVYALGMAALDRIHHAELAALDGPNSSNGPEEPTA